LSPIASSPATQVEAYCEMAAGGMPWRYRTWRGVESIYEAPCVTALDHAADAL